MSPSPSRNRSLSYSTHRKRNHYCSRMSVKGARRPPLVNHLRDANKIISLLIRHHKQAARAMPEQFDYAAQMRDYLEDRHRRELDAILQPALDKIYGPSHPRSDPEPPHPNSAHPIG